MADRTADTLDSGSNGSSGTSDEEIGAELDADFAAALDADQDHEETESDLGAPVLDDGAIDEGAGI